MDILDNGRLDRREMLRGSAIAGASAALMQPLPLLAKTGRLGDVRKAAEAGKEASIKRLREWIALPSIAAENRNMP